MKKFSVKNIANKIEKYTLQSNPLKIYDLFLNETFVNCFVSYRDKGKLPMSEKTSLKLKYLFEIGCFLSELKENKFPEEFTIKIKETISFLILTKDFLLTKNVITNKKFQEKFQKLTKNFSKKEKSFVRYWRKKEI